MGCFAATGVPLMALAMGNIAAMVITIGDPDEAEKTIGAKVTIQELHMMRKFDLDDGDGQISRAEYILLCSVRLGALSPDLISKINDRFKALDISGDGMLSYAEILENPESETQNILHIMADLETGRLQIEEEEPQGVLLHALSTGVTSFVGAALSSGSSEDLLTGTGHTSWMEVKTEEDLLEVRRKQDVTPDFFNQL